MSRAESDLATLSGGVGSPACTRGRGDVSGFDGWHSVLGPALEQAFSADGTSGTVVVSDGPYGEATEYLGGITIIEVETLQEAREWAARVAEGCGWPQEVRVVM